MTEQTTTIRQFSCVVATSGRAGGDGITIVTVSAADYAEVPTAVRRAVAARFSCPCVVLDIKPYAG